MFILLQLYFAVKRFVEVFATLFLFLQFRKDVVYNEFEIIKLITEAIIMANLSDRIKSLRLSADMTQEEFGKKFGIVKSTVSLYESGKSTPNRTK